MMSGRAQRAPVKLLALFVLLSVVPLVALGALGWRVLQQDRALESQRLRERLENAASLVARDLDRTLTTWEELLPVAARGQAVTLPSGTVFLLISPAGVVQLQGTSLPYYPRVPHASGAVSPLFAAAEAEEFRAQNLPAAIEAYRGLASFPDKSVRAEALMRLARCLRKQQHPREALIVYGRLLSLGDVTVAGSPAELVARRERTALLTAMGDAAAAMRERALLAAALTEGRFRIDRATFDYFNELASPNATTAGGGAAVDLAAAVDVLWPTWLEQNAGRTTWTSGAATVVSVWRRTPAGTATITTSLDGLTASLSDALHDLDVTVQFHDRAGKAIWGTVPAGRPVTKTSQETGLPWSLHVAGAQPTLTGTADAQRNLVVAGFVLMTLVVSAAGYFVFRAVNRELGVARLQSDFVAAVSHEFRTPLTAMCHLTEMLEQGDANPARLPEYYRALGKESRRLHAMVESLLDFGRMDSGRRSYDFAETDAVELVDRVAQEFADRSPAAAPRIEKQWPPSDSSGLVVRADREALSLAVRNLLDNAMKYSPESSPVRLAVAQHNGTVFVSVEDRGAGIGAEERREIFRKFTRGAAARTLNVKGTGIGLTMADQIVKAHGGRLELESEPGRGSTFTIVLPVISTPRRPVRAVAAPVAR